MSVDPVELYGRAYGEGAPLVILHGLLGSGGNWHTLSRNVFSKQFKVFAVDLRNHGRSPHADRFDYPAMVADLELFIGKHALAPVDLIGHSLGGKVAMYFALENPAQVNRLVVVDIAPKAYKAAHHTYLDALYSVDLTSAGSRSDVEAKLAETISSVPIRQFLMKNLAYDAESESYSWMVNLDVVREQYENINAAIGNTWTFEGPTLFLRGENSDYITDEDMEHILHLFPAARLETIPNAGHWIHADNPEAFSEVVLDFLTA